MEQVGKIIQLPVDAQTLALNSNACQRGCHDGWIIKNNTAYRCDCLMQEIERARHSQLIANADVAGCEHMTFEAYRPIHSSQQKALKVMDGNHGSFFLCGNYGTGKTHLATASVLRAVDAGLAAVKISVPRLLDLIRRRGRDNNPAEIEDQAATIPYLVLDDIGKQKDTDWTDERLFILIDERYKRWTAGQGHTTITSNFKIEDLAKRIDGATVDRIKGMCKMLMVTGDSYRGSK